MAVQSRRWQRNALGAVVFVVLFAGGCGNQSDETATEAEVADETTTTSAGESTPTDDHDVNDDEDTSEPEAVPATSLPLLSLKLSGADRDRFVDLQAAFDDLNMSGDDQARVVQQTDVLFGGNASVATRALAIEGHKIGGTIVDVWSSDPNYLIDGTGMATGMIAVAIEGSDQVVSVPFWDQGGNWALAAPAVLDADAMSWAGAEVGPELIVGESWQLPSVGLAVLLPGAVAFIDDTGQPAGHVVTTNLAPSDGTLTEWLAAAGRDLEGFSGAFYGECVELADRSLQVCSNDAGSLTLIHDGEVVAGPDSWDELAATVADQSLPAGEITFASYSAEADAWLLAWGDQWSCWVPNALVLQDGQFTHPTGEPLSSTPAVRPVGWVGDSVVYRTWGSQGNECTPGADEATIYLKKPGQDAIAVFPEFRNLNVLTFQPSP